MGCMFHVWWPWKILLQQQLETERVRYGLATYTTLCLIVVTAAWPVRQWAYEVFIVSHTLFLVFLVLVGLHTPYAMRFTAAGIICYVLNWLTGWCIKTHLAQAQATVFQGRLTRLRMDRVVNHGPGQHIYVCVPSISMIQWHPFTISSAGNSRHTDTLNDDSTMMTIHARAVGGFTRELCRWPENVQRRVILTGPYGQSVSVGQGQDTFKVVFVAAGSGLAYIVPILMDLLQRRKRLEWLRDSSSNNDASVEIIWCVRDPDEVQWFQSELEMALDAAQGHFDHVDKEKDDVEDEDVDLITAGSIDIRLRMVIHYTTVAFGNQESLVVPAPISSTSHVKEHQEQQEQQGQQQVSDVSQMTSLATSTRGSLNVPFAGDDRVKWVGSRLDVKSYIKKQIEGIPRDRAIDIVGCGPSLMLAELHNAVAAKEELFGCRVNLHTERFYL
ncbi:hypothetical protein BX616_004646 [Lobosporangium transversale]|nr:hypothetical protein BX616_004646 [Lobosporangium transversale]